MSDIKSEIAKWRATYPTIEISDEALKTAAPFPSLRATEFMHYMESKDDPGAARFVRDLRREVRWTYDNWKQALRDSDAKALLLDMLNDAKGVGQDASYFAPIERFIRDYAKTHGHELELPKSDYSFLDAMDGPVVPEAESAVVPMKPRARKNA